MKQVKKIVMTFVMMALFCVMMTSAFSLEQISALNLEFISQTPDPVEPGNFVELRWRVTNEGGRTEDYRFELEADYPFTLDQTQTPAVVTRRIAGFQGGDSTSDILFYRVRVADDAVEGDANKIRLKYSRVSAGSSEITIEQPIRIQSQEGLIEIERVDIIPEEITIGSKFKVQLTVNNLGASSINNLKLTLDTEDTGFTPIGSSNQKIVSRLSGKQKQIVEFEFFADGNTEVQVYTIPISASYTDSLGRSNSIDTEIGFPIEAKPYYLYNLEKTDIFTADSQGQIITSISNIGKSDINFVVLEIMETDDYVVLTTPKTYLGNLESDDFETGQYDIFVKPTDKESIPLVFTARYRDAYDKTYTDTFSIDMRLFDQDQAQKLGLIQGSRGGGASIIIVLIVVGIIFFWYRSKKKKAKNGKN